MKQMTTSEDISSMARELLFCFYIKCVRERLNIPVDSCYIDERIVRDARIFTIERLN